MALISPIHGTMSGKIAGNVWSHNKGGQYVRQRVIPVNRNSIRQQVLRTNLAANSRLWLSGLTGAGRQSWVDWANANPVTNRLGHSIQLTGIAAFNALNQLVRDFGGSAVLTTPVGTGPGIVTGTSVASNTATTIVFTLPAALAAGQRLQAWWTGAGRASQDPNFNQATLIGYSAAAAGPAVTITLPASVVAGQLSNFYLVVVDAAGRSGPPFKIRYTFA